MSKALPFDRLDPQRDLVYAAELEVFPRDKDVVLSLAELQDEVNRVLALTWFKRVAGDVKRLRVGDGRGAKWSRTSRGIIHLLRVSRVLDVLYHEVVHQVIPAGVEWHGAVFCGMLLYFVGKLYGQPTKVKLRQAFGRAGISWDRRLARFGDLARNGEEGEA